ncbi:MAG: riboflavin biosynthesis protein RibF [Muribaculaceae bacterium]|nr:riboflavin biosynthesis protein RibF [Muribaculaceae bacterium]
MDERRRYAAVVGTFDGVHRGHRYLLDDLRQRAGARGLATRVYTFTDHPLATLCPSRAPFMLTTAAEKIGLLGRSGIDEYSICDFAEVAPMTAREYIELLAREGVGLLLIGYDNRFGSDRLVTVDQFVKAADGTGVEIQQAPELTDADGNPINSSRIRQLIADGDITAANALLGYRYELTGPVVHGKQLGRTIGFPTANQYIADGRKLIPAAGVYACLAAVDGREYPAMVNIGHRPTVDRSDAPLSIEAHIIGADTDLYDRMLTLKVCDRLRPERRFDSLDALRRQLELDRATTLTLLQRQ